MHGESAAAFTAASFNAFRSSHAGVLMEKCPNWTGSAAVPCTSKRAVPLAVASARIGHETPSGFIPISALSSAPAAENKELLHRYKHDHWLKNVLTIRKSVVLRRISSHIAFNVVTAVVLVVLRTAGVLTAAIPAAFHSLCGAFLGLLVTFRTNSAYAR